MGWTTPTVAADALVAGVDTHADTHTLAILTGTGTVIMTETFTANRSGYHKLIAALDAAGQVAIIGVEGTNSYGAGLTRSLLEADYTVHEVLRPTRQVRRMDGKSDPIDAVEAAHTVLSGRGVSIVKDSASPAESLRFLLAARNQMIHTTTALASSMASLLVTAPETVRAKYRDLNTTTLVRRLAASRPDHNCDSVHAVVTQSLREMAKAHQDAKSRAERLQERMRALLEAYYPAVLGVYGAGPVVAAQLVVTAGGNPGRIRSEAAFAHLCGAAPIPASSGKTNRHRLNRGGDRRGNTALHRIALIRMQRDPRTKEYVARRRSEGKNTREIMRCLKRAIAREIYRVLTSNPVTTIVTDLRELRQTQHITLKQAAQALGTWPSRISDIEHHRRPLPELTHQYQKWLTTT